MSKQPIKRLFGGALQAAVEAVESQGADAISVADAGTKVAFLDSWTRALTAYAKRLRSNDQALDAPIMLVYVDDCGKFAAAHCWKTNPLLGTAPTDNLAGILAVGTTEFGGCIHPARFMETAEFASEIERLELSSSLTVALMSATMLIVWPEGIHSGARPNIRELDDGPIVIDLEKIGQELDLFYMEEARDRTKWWRDAERRITVNRPEGAVQETLRVFLVARFAEVAKVREEIVSGNGRTDITIQPTNGSQDSAVLELKTIRDVRTPKRAGNTPIEISLLTNIRWAKSGIQQAAAYRDRERFTGAFLCLYDFCATQGATVEAEIVAPAVQYSVCVKRYWITASHEELREAEYPVT